MRKYYTCKCGGNFIYDSPQEFRYKRFRHNKTKMHKKYIHELEMKVNRENGCDCLNPETEGNHGAGIYHYSNSCPIHNLYPDTMEE